MLQTAFLFSILRDLEHCTPVSRKTQDGMFYFSKHNVSGHSLVLVVLAFISTVVPLQGTAPWAARHPSLKAGVKHG
jgi:hypothetical protein